MVIDSNEDEKLMYAKIDDKIKLSKTRNKILNTDFLYEEQIAKVEKYLRSIKHQNYLYFGGYLNASRKVLIIYPEKLTEEIVKKNLNAIFSAIRIELPNELKGTYSHKDFLGGIMKLGIAREKIGDIITVDNGADIIILKENEEYIYENLKLLTRFRKSNISVIDIVDIVVKETEFENFSVIVSSMRIDNFISELATLSPDFILFDMPPSYSELDKKVLLGSDEVIPVLQIDKYSIDGLSDFFLLLTKLKSGDPKPVLEKLIFNNYDKRKAVQKSLITTIDELTLKKYKVPNDEIFKKAALQQKAVQALDRMKPDTTEVLETIVNDIIGE